MTTAATALLGLALPVTGELSGTWGDTVNNSITSLLDSAVAGTTTLSADADVTLTTTTLAANQARSAVLLWTAGGTATRTITAPAASKAYIIINKTSSTQAIKIVGVGPTTGVTIAAGTQALVVWNGLDFVAVATASAAGVVPIANGGTGATTASTARTSLGLAIGTDVPSPTGTGASGTWGINISGTAAAATFATTATSASSLTTPSYTVVESGGYLYFRYGGVNKMRLDPSGNIVVTGNVTAYGSI